MQSKVLVPIIITRDNNTYIAYANVNNRYRILCHSNDFDHAHTIVQKYIKDPANFTFRYKD